MKFSAILAFAVGALAVINNFDETTGQRLNLVNQSLGPSGGLYYKGIGLAQIYDNDGPLQALTTTSIPNVLAFGNLDRMDDDYPYITSTFTGSAGNSFTLNSFKYGCVLGNLAANCTIIVAAYSGGRRVAGQRIIYSPTARQDSPLALVSLDSTFRGIQSVRFATRFTDRASFPGLGGATFLDDINYIITVGNTTST